jgi:predicted enzyme related to lactoylglutathione lyase
MHMADAKTFVVNAPTWIDLSSTDPAGSRDFYSKLFGWHAEPEKDPNAGGYAVARLGDKDVAGIGGTQDPNAPSAWMVYIGTKDADAISKKIEAAGGKVVAPAFEVMDAGRMAVYQDPTGAFISAWQPNTMDGFDVMRTPGSFSWAELNSRGIDKAKEFYSEVFGWTTKDSPMGEGQPMYTEFQLGGESIAGGMEMNEMVPQEVPSYFTVYFGASDVDAAHEKAVGLGAKEMVPPSDFPGGRFSLLSDPQGAMFGLLSTDQS